MLHGVFQCHQCGLRRETAIERLLQRGILINHTGKEGNRDTQCPAPSGHDGRPFFQQRLNIRAPFSGDDPN